jgi:hypothetical protein
MTCDSTTVVTDALTQMGQTVSEEERKRMKECIEEGKHLFPNHKTVSTD